MITASTQAKTVLEQDPAIKINLGCTLEYNINNLVDGIIVTAPNISRYDSGTGVYYPFKNLFPSSSIIKPNRPLGAGIKYGIFGDVTSGTYRNPTSIDYSIDYRTYYPGAETFYKYYVADKNTGLDVTVTYPKQILTNKIVIKFELAHSTPSTWTVYNGGSQIATGNSSAIKPFKTGNTKNYDAGTLTLYYNGTSWSTTEPTTIATPTTMNSIRLTTGAVSGKYIGLIEISPRWIVDISENIISMSINRESSSDSAGILPVGNVSANSLSLSLVSYENPRQIINFTKSMSFNSSYKYLYKQGEIKPFYKLYHSAGTLSDSGGQYEKINQGTFYIHSWTTSEFGDISLTALDSAKILQDSISPNILCKGFSTTAILRNLLDSIGFTNYNFNFSANNSSVYDDTSVMTLKYWWSDENIQVWSLIQDLCADSQMIATFDENNILQFYTRDYTFKSSRTPNWSFRYAANSGDLSNIISFEKEDLPSANEVKVLWNNVTTSEYSGNSQPLWKSGNSFMGALALAANLPSSSGAGSYISLLPVTVNETQANQILWEYSGYLVINSEIIEYDAIQYQYVTSNNQTLYVDIAGPGDEKKYLGLGIPGSSNYKPSGKYRIKSRGAFNTPVSNHYAAASDIVNSWNGYRVIWE